MFAASSSFIFTLNKDVSNSFKMEGHTPSILLKEMVMFVTKINASTDNSELESIVLDTINNIPILALYKDAARIGSTDPLVEAKSTLGALADVARDYMLGKETANFCNLALQMMLVHDLGKNLLLQMEATGVEGTVANHDLALPSILRFLAKSAKYKDIIIPVTEETLETFAKFWECHQNWPRAALGEMTEQEFNLLEHVQKLSKEAQKLGARESRYDVIGTPIGQFGFIPSLQSICKLNKEDIKGLPENFPNNLKELLRAIFDDLPAAAAKIFNDPEIPSNRKYFMFLKQSLEAKIAKGGDKAIAVIDSKEKYEDQMAITKFFTLAGYPEIKDINPFLDDKIVQEKFLTIVTNSTILNDFFINTDNKVDLYYLPDAWRNFLKKCTTCSATVMSETHLPNFLQILEITIKEQIAKSLDNKLSDNITTIDLKIRWQELGMGTNNMDLDKLDQICKEYHHKPRTSVLRN